MENLTIKNLPKGTLAKVRKKAAQDKTLFYNGKPNVQAYIRNLIVGDADAKSK